MVVGPPPFEMGDEFASELSGGPGAASESGEGVTEGQIETLDEGGVEGARESQGLEAQGELGQVAPTHETFDEVELATAIGFLDLSIEQVAGDEPTGLARCGVGEPLAEMGSQGVKVEIETVAGKDGKTAWS